MNTTRSKNNYFEVIRAGINTTFQDNGRKNLNHIGIPISGAMDKRNYLLANALLKKDLNSPAIEFAYQGPLLKYSGEKVFGAITGDVKFQIIKNSNEIINGETYEVFLIENSDQINIQSTNKSVYGYLSISENFILETNWGSVSTNTKAKIGANNGKKLLNNQKINIDHLNKNKSKNKLNYINSKIEYIRVIKSINFNYFSDTAKKIFLNEEFKVTKLTDRMGMRIEGQKLDNVISSNIKSEGLIKGVIQVPSDGNPIIMFSDHGTIGGYPKIANVISADFDKLVQMIPGSIIKFKEVSLDEAEKLFKFYNLETNNLINQIS
tara:strand:+ start:2539 stop:3504 length:966 start_codon:yes stop_codon:yes gene_type:complete